jgi:16S rRNA (cytidine1402-2'-O)-methyltransferase
MSRLVCIPVPLDPSTPVAEVLSGASIAQVRPLAHFIVEDPKTARHFLRQFETVLPLQQLSLHAIGKHERQQPGWARAALAPALAGTPMGLLSEAGCPAVADPGAEVVAMAHANSITVEPLVGPNSLLLALMGSGLSGQQFAFVGYLPAAAAERARSIVELEQRSLRHRETILAIETPFRALALWNDLVAQLKPQTRLAVALDLGTSQQLLAQHPVSRWRTMPCPVHGKPLMVVAFQAANAP